MELPLSLCNSKLKVGKNSGDISTILCQLGQKWDIGLHSGTVPAKPGHLSTM